MAFLRRKTDGATTDWLAPDSQEYQLLRAMRVQSATAALTPTSSGIISGETGGQLQPGAALWEDIAEEEVGFPDPPGGRVLVVALPGAATGADETVQVEDQSGGLAGTLTDVQYVPNAAINGVVTNNRTITLNEVKVTGTASPARSVTALAAVTFDATHSNAGPGGGAAGVGPVGTPLTISQAAFTAVPPDQLEVVSSHNGTGLADPGGVLFAVYTRA